MRDKNETVLKIEFIIVKWTACSNPWSGLAGLYLTREDSCPTFSLSRKKVIESLKEKTLFRPVDCFGRNRKSRKSIYFGDEENSRDLQVHPTSERGMALLVVSLSVLPLVQNTCRRPSPPTGPVPTSGQLRLGGGRKLFEPL